MTCSVAVVLSGCGHLDGSEIHEAVLTLLHLDQRGATVTCLAPQVPLQVVDHATGQATGQTRSAFAEAARIARGRIRDLAGARAAEFDALVLPGGYGAAKNLCDFAGKGAAATVHGEVARLLREMHAAQKPIGAICIAPAVVAAVLGRTAHPVLTIGDDAGTAAALRAMGAEHRDCVVTEVVVDAPNRIVTTPAYMFDAHMAQVAVGIGKLVDAVLALAGRAAPAGARR
jgi:enhancing lycopene biosynthesis protein 2